MAKKSKISLGTILLFLGIILGLSALVCFAGDGLAQTMKAGGVEGTLHYNLAGFLTGVIKPSLTVSTGESKEAVDAFGKVEGYRSYFVIFALVLTILGTLTAVAGTVTKKHNKILLLVSGLCFVLAGVFAFLIKVAGTAPEDGLTFAEIFNGEMKFDLGLGTIFYGVLSILGGLSITAGTLLRK